MAKKLDIRSLSNDEVQSRLNDARQELMNLRFQQATGELTDYTRLSQTKRLIARMLTILHERQQGMEGGA